MSVHTQSATTELEHIWSLAGGLRATVRQLASTARMIANIAPTEGEEPEIEMKDIGQTMTLFTLHLAAIEDGLDDIIGRAADVQTGSKMEAV